MKIIKVLGDERMYLMSDGTKRPFDYVKSVEPKVEMVSMVTLEKAIEVSEQKQIKKGKRTK